MVSWRDQKAGNHQLPDLQAGTGRAVLRQDFRADQGLRMQLRQIQTHEAPGGDLRKCGVEVIQSKVRRERMAHIELATPVLPHLVSQEPAQQDRQPSRHDPQKYGEGALLRQYIVIDPKETP
jgi:hypothetical protein